MIEYVSLDSGLLVPGHYDLAPQPKALDLFCGAGGFSLGMERAGFDVVAACDSDPTAAITYLVNLGAYPCQMYWLDAAAKARMERVLQREFERHERGEIARPPVSGSNRQAPGGCKHFFFGDVRNLRGADVLRALKMERGELDCIFGGPPCQGFSSAGRRDVMDPRNSLVFEFTRLVCEIQPKTLCMENVPAMASMVTPEGLPVIEAICLSLAKGGYGTLESMRRALGAGLERRGAIRGRQRGAREELPAEPRQRELF